MLGERSWIVMSSLHLADKQLPPHFTSGSAGNESDVYSAWSCHILRSHSHLQISAVPISAVVGLNMIFALAGLLGQTQGHNLV